jgi:ribosomal protein L11 methyltransferase
MAAARVWDARVLATDVDPVAIEVAEANLAANGLTGRIETLVADGLAHPRLADAAPFDLVLANILMAPLVGLAPGIGQVTAAGGTAVLSGLLNDQADAVAHVYEDAGFVAGRRDVIGDWTTLTLRRG